MLFEQFVIDPLVVLPILFILQYYGFLKLEFFSDSEEVS